MLLVGWWRRRKPKGPKLMKFDGWEDGSAMRKDNLITDQRLNFLLPLKSRQYKENREMEEEE